MVKNVSNIDVDLLPNHVGVFACDEIPKVSGVYRLGNIASGDSYVGGACNIRRRISLHSQRLNRGLHTYAVQLAFGNHFAKLFAELIEPCPLEQVSTREAHWIEKLNPTLNVRRDTHFAKRDTPLFFDAFGVNLKARIPLIESMQLFKVYGEDASDFIEVMAFSKDDAAKRAIAAGMKFHGAKADDLIVRYLRTVRVPQQRGEVA